ncbi:PhzF family phenazine biosynthesis protein [Streptomyces sp. ME02-6979-3A]|uniref:PhzF family phenazine biosynthesis protein n=1 Tax=Streptomyces silvae TaxID=2803812 RepID=A0ABU7ZZD6_9ACTN|nr:MULTISPECIES: PhzF family phenazine biosynthesis protein [unclassified Streptomyces]MDX3326873.1 PhzF family phenazine biosynthesis protein [Streptomyces sp. ME02-6979-3A]RPK42977.1 Phenazine biosynthesis-like protein [Streptomyces sp. ADI93-02]WSS75573.1 PhzF family phenazine biosynthesis protein [Streptomyces sp. NBC_01174]
MNDFEVPEGIDVLRVFCGPDGRHGNALGVVRDGRRYPGNESRQALARKLGFSETVFVDDPERGTVDIRTPGLRLPFAGHPLVGAAWLLDLEVLELPVGDVTARQDGEFTWITARPEWAPPRTLERYASVAEVEALTEPPPGEGWLYVWAWEDEAAGRVRARAFPRRHDERGDSRSSGAGARTGGVDEDEATGAAAMLLSAELGRALNITQGRGSQILTAPAPDGTMEIGGRVLLVVAS